jgi:dihydroorotate dehydrogenase
MYKSILRPLLFIFSPESIHHFIVFLLKVLFVIPFASSISKKIFSVNNTKLERKVFGLTFKNPVGFAAGFDKNAEVFNEMANFGFSHIEIGTVTPKAQKGNPKPRLFRLKKDQGLINRMGFNNHGAEKVSDNLKKKMHKVIVGGNLGKNTNTSNEDAINDYAFCFEMLYEYVDYFAVNVSCPNIANLSKLQDKDYLSKILSRIKELNALKPVQKPILLKIAPDLSNNQLDDIIDIIINLKIDGVIATNTTTSRENLKTPKTIIERIGNGGLSGKPLNNRSTEVIRYLSEKSGKAFPIIGVGGIHSVQDAVEKINAGATLIQVYTGFIYEGPSLVKKINKTLLKIS